jgi:LuxR family quorum sensing-dependent transcriptional regulator
VSFDGDEYGKRALDFVQRLQRLSDYQEICELIVKELAWFGLTHVSSISLPGPGRDAIQCILMNNRPQEYVDRYIEKNYVIRDPVVTELRNTLHPYTWSDIRSRRDLNKAQKAIMDEGREFDARDGIVIPVATLSGSVSLFSPCGREPNLCERARAALEIVGVYSQHALKRALIRNQREESSHTPLTPREREIMQWVATGKTDEEIGEILSIGTSTVTSHVENAKQKLDAFRRTYAVVQALRFGEISL